jgi:hypothetical protein
LLRNDVVLAYLFWHRPLPDLPREAYEAALREFQRALAQARPAGLIQAEVFRCDRIPWLDGRAGYADWYLLEDSAALDVLNEAAVSTPCRAAHDHAAAMAETGVAGLYRLRLGAPRLAVARGATWLAKRRGESYPEFFARAQEAWIEPGVSLFGRQMTLGPTPEFCLLARGPLLVEDERAPIRVRYAPIA